MNGVMFGLFQKGEYLMKTLQAILVMNVKVGEIHDKIMSLILKLVQRLKAIYIELIMAV